MPPEGIHYRKRVAAFHETRSVTDQRKLKKDTPIKGNLPQLMHVADFSVKLLRNLKKKLYINLNLPL